jgi:hypothetical protein
LRAPELSATSSIDLIITAIANLPFPFVILSETSFVSGRTSD